MARALIQTVNETAQAVEINGIISPGTVQRRFGCALQLSGNAITAAKHMLTGVMFHARMAEYFDFLRLDGYRVCQEYHMAAEQKGLRELLEQDELEAAWEMGGRVKDVDGELREIKDRMYWLNAVDFGAEAILGSQAAAKDHYEKLMREL